MLGAVVQDAEKAERESRLSRHDVMDVAYRETGLRSRRKTRNCEECEGQKVAQRVGDFAFGNN